MTASYAALLEPKGNLLEDICDPERSMAGQVPLKNTSDFGTLLAQHSKKSHPWPIPPEDEAANLDSQIMDCGELHRRTGLAVHSYQCFSGLCSLSIALHLMWQGALQYRCNYSPLILEAPQQL